MTRAPIRRIDELLAPVEWREFLERYWQREPLHLPRNTEDGFADLVALEEVDHLLAQHAGKADFPLSVVGSRIDTGVPEHLRSSDRSHWTPDRVFERLALGATVRLGNVGRYVSAVGLLENEFETAFQTDVSINLYYTPRRARAFEAHSDNHDVFILQLEGRKRWHLYQFADQLPLETVHRGRLEWQRGAGAAGAFQPPPDTRQLTEDRLLEPGDLLYVPRGLVHRVLTLDDGPSLHLTVAVPVVTWYEACVVALLDAAQRSPVLREALPVDFATAPESIGADRYERVREAVASHLDAATLERTVATMGRQFVDSRRGHWQHTTRDVEAIEQLTLDTRLMRRPALLYRIERHPAQLVLSYWGHHIPVPIRCESMLATVLSGEPFTPRQLPSQLDGESRLVFCRALLAKGFIGRVDD